VSGTGSAIGGAVFGSSAAGAASAFFFAIWVLLGRGPRAWLALPLSRLNRGL
jgi:hypothetical protein